MKFAFKYFLFSFVILLSSCNQMSDDELNYHLNIYNGIKENNEFLRQKIEDIKMEVGNKTKHPMYSYKAKIWFPKVDSISTAAQHILIELNSIKNKLITATNPCFKTIEGKVVTDNNCQKKIYNSSLIYCKQNPFLAKEYFESLYAKQKQFLKYSYRIVTMGLDSGNNPYYYKEQMHYINSFEEKFIIPFSEKEYSSTFTERKFIEILIGLEEYKRKILSIEYEYLCYCESNTNIIVEEYECFQAIFSASTNIAKPNELLEIYAGKGSFTEDGNPEITINKKNVPLQNGMATYKFRASKIKGEHKVPVRISFLREDGTRTVMGKTIVYTVVDTICR